MKELPGTLSFFIRHAIILVLFLVFSSGNALAQDFTISGYVKEDGAGLSGVTMSGLPGSPVTDATGFYSDTVPSGWTGTVTPSLAGYTFDPSFIPYTNVITDQINQNYEVTYKEFITNAELVNISEGGVASFQVKLSFPPESSITATVSRLSGDSDITVSSGASLSFDSDSWDTYQTVTLAAAEDDDATNGTATIRVHDDASSLPDKDITANEQEDDSLGFETNTDTVGIPEGSTGSFQIRLTADPLGTVNVSVARSAGDTDINVQSGASLTFDSETWDSYQMVTLAALEDGDTVNGSATIQVSDDATVIPSKTVTATEQDNDTLNFETEVDTLGVPEGGTANFGVRLTADPLGTVSVTVSRSGGDSDISVQSGASLAFNSTNWSDYHTVTLAAAQDGDAANGTATILIHDNAAVIADITVTATEQEDDSLSFETDVDVVGVPEGGTATFQVRLTADPLGTVNVSVSRAAGDSDISVQSGSSLTFNSGDWNTYQIVTLSAVQDADVLDGSATIRVSDLGGGISSKDINANEEDDDTLGIETDVDTVGVPEGGTATFQVRLTADPSGTVNVTVARADGDTSITVSSGASLSFDSGSWDTYQTVTLAAAEDGDAVNGSATIRLSAPSISGKDITATEEENDTLGFETNTDVLNVPEGGNADFQVRLTADPLETVNTTVARISGDSDITIQSEASLTFDSTNWNIYRTVSVAAAQDDDILDSNATIRVRDNAADLPDKMVTATEEDDDILDFQTDVDVLTVPEGNTADFQVRLTADPSGVVNVTVSRISGDDDITVESGAGLVFNSTNWNKYHLVTLAAAQDDDIVNGTSSIRVHDNSAVLADKNVTANEEDDDTLNFQTDVGSITVPEGSTAQFTVRLTADPLDTVNASVARTGGDADITVTEEGQDLVFDSSNWSDPQPVTLSAAEDDDAAPGSATIQVSASGIESREVTANEEENDSLNFEASPDAVTVPEGSTAQFTIQLTADPLSTVNVTVAWTGGDEDITVSQGVTLTFDSTDWNDPHEVVLHAAQDDDVLDGTATIRISDDASDIPSINVTATEQDDDTLDFATDVDTLDVPEGSAATFQVRLTADPSGTVNVEVSRAGGDTDISVSSGNSLVFDSSNWNDFQVVTLEAAEDADIEDGSAVIRIHDTASGISDKNITAGEEDNDELNFITNTDNVIVPEDGTASFFVRLSHQPPANGNASVDHVGGDPDITVQSGAKLLFTTSNWDQDQEVVLAAAEDPDIDDGTATIRISSFAVPDKEITATEQDNAILNGEVGMSFNSQEGTSGSLIDVFVEIFNNKSAVSSFEFDFTYDSTMFVYKGAVPGALTSDWGVLTAAVQSPGNLAIEGVSGGGTIIPASSSGSVIQIKLQVRCLDYTQDTDTQLRTNNYAIDMIDFAPEPCTGLFTFKPCSHLGDVNGDGSVTPGDAQKAFEIFLGRITPDMCQVATSDANCSVSTTPGDSQQIFEHFLGRRVLPECCAEGAAAGGTTARYFETPGFPGESERNSPWDNAARRLLYPLDTIGLSGETVSVPVIVTDPAGLKSFGFELSYPAGLLEYLGTAKSRLTGEYTAVNGFAEAPGLIRVTGESDTAIQINDTGALAVIRFKVKPGSDARLPLILLSASGDTGLSRLKRGYFRRIREGFQDTRFLHFGGISHLPDGTVKVPVRVSSAFNMKSFGLVLKYAEENLTFMGVAATGMTQDFVALDAAEMKPGIIRVGGYAMSAIQEFDPGALFHLIFTVNGGGGEVEMMRLMDDLQMCTIQEGSVLVQ